MKPPFLLQIFLLLLLLNVTHSVQAQIHDEYIKGTIVLKNKETKQGYIMNDAYEKMKFKIKFKLSKDSEQVICYDTSSVKSIVMEDGEVYDLLRFKPHTRKDSISVFARLILKGKASLYKVYYGSTLVYIVYNNLTTYPIQDDELLMNSTEPTLFNYKDYLKNAFVDYDDLMMEIDKMDFSEEEVIKLTKAYNLHHQSESTTIKSIEKSKSFIVINADGWFKNPYHNLFTFEGNYRVYYPKISKSTSINWGLKYWSNRYSNQEQFGSITNGVPDPGYLDTSVHYKQSFLAIPFNIQQNILNKWLRPYFYFGFTLLSFYKKVNNIYQEDNGKGFGNTWGIIFSGGAGIEADVYKGLMLRSEYRSENRRITVGIGYHFKLN